MIAIIKEYGLPVVAALAIGIICYILCSSIPWSITAACISMMAFVWSKSTKKQRYCVKKAKPNHAKETSHLNHLQKALGYKYGRYNMTRNVIIAFNLLKEICQQKNTSANTKMIGESMFELADCYEQGIGTQTCISKAIHWYKRCYIAGHLCEENRIEHYNHLINRLVSTMTAEAQNGNRDSMHALGYYYRYQHLHTDKSEIQKQSFDWFQRAANENHAEATVELAYAFYHGIGTSTNYQNAKDYFQYIVEEYKIEHHTIGVIGSLIHLGKSHEAEEIIEKEKKKSNPNRELIDIANELYAFHLIRNPIATEEVKAIDDFITLPQGKTPNYNLYDTAQASQESNLSFDYPDESFIQALNSEMEKLNAITKTPQTCKKQPVI